jgi:hypothetical protein
MELQNHINEERKTISKQWVKSLLDDYPADASAIFMKLKDRFANPVGTNAVEALNKILDIIFDFSTELSLTPEMEQLIKVRAVQNFTPEQSLGFIFRLKKILRDNFKKAKVLEKNIDTVLTIESRIDGMAIKLFNFYMQSREQVFNIRVNELKTGRHIITEGAKCPSRVIKEIIKKQETKNL